MWGMRAALILLMGVAMGRAAGGEPGGSRTQEQGDLQAIEVSEEIVMKQAQAGGDVGPAMDRLEKTFEGLEAKYPRSAAVRDEHGNYLWLQERKEAAFAKWEEASKLDPRDPDICLHLGTSWLEQGNVGQAMDYFRRASALAPRDALLHFHLGNGLYLFRHYLTTAEHPETEVVDDALKELAKAVELEPLNADYAKGYADTFYSLPAPKWEEALKAWQHVYAISADKDLASINLARVSLLMNDNAGAKKYLEQVTGGDFQMLKKKLEAKAGETAVK